MADIFDIESLFPQMILAVGLALLAGNGFAWFQNRQGKKPKDVEGEFRPGRAIWLAIIGLVMAVWGGVSVFT